MNYQILEKLVKAIDQFAVSLKPTAIDLTTEDGRHWRGATSIEISWPPFMTPKEVRVCEQNLEMMAELRWNQTYVFSPKATYSEDVQPHIVTRYQIIGE